MLGHRHPCFLIDSHFLSWYDLHDYLQSWFTTPEGGTAIGGIDVGLRVSINKLFGFKPVARLEVYSHVLCGNLSRLPTGTGLQYDVPLVTLTSYEVVV